MKAFFALLGIPRDKGMEYRQLATRDDKRGYAFLGITTLTRVAIWLRT
ncbi:hypothetical protein ACFWVP_19530 [Streptomyces sp. NPDC058637]